MSAALKVETLEQLAAGRLSISAAAATLNLSEAEVVQWQELYALSAEIAARGERARSMRVGRATRRAALAVTATVVIGIGFSASHTAWAQSACASTLPSPLVTFCPDSPALASNVNGNFQQVVNWVQEKVGTVGTPNVTMTGSLTAPNITASTVVTAPRANVNGPIYRGSVAPATGDLGLYSQVGGNYMRFVTTAGPFFWFSDGAPANGYSGATSLMGLDTSGNLTLSGQLAAGSIRQRSCAWGPRGPPVTDDSSYHSVYCPSGTYMAGWQCKANGYLDGDCAAWCCSP